MTRFELENTPGVNDVLTFGKFKGATILEVIDKKPSYIVWCIQNISGFSIDEKLRKELMRQYERHFRSNARELLLMHKFGMHSTEASDFLEYDEPEHF